MSGVIDRRNETQERGDTDTPSASRVVVWVGSQSDVSHESVCPRVSVYGTRSGCVAGFTGPVSEVVAGRQVSQLLPTFDRLFLDTPHSAPDTHSTRFH